MGRLHIIIPFENDLSSFIVFAWTLTKLLWLTVSVNLSRLHFHWQNATSYCSDSGKGTSIDGCIIYGLLETITRFQKQWFIKLYVKLLVYIRISQYTDFVFRTSVQNYRFLWPRVWAQRGWVSERIFYEYTYKILYYSCTKGTATENYI